ncbi:cell wall hydrolase [Acinetobacter sp. BIT-DXN8]|uniref:Cell wall hydrolase n=1 Tax=Acinetobacter entericus TaxID=2989714 RepID=A0ABT3NNE3_9GAMM|nr:cell wall hydrolase [Acinetobacter entericus]
MKVASTEVVGGLKGKNFENQAAGVIDTILNRAASGKFGGGVRDVVNQRWAFSDINAPRKGAYGSVQNVPMSRVSKRMETFVRNYLEARANGKDSSVGLNISYANPFYLGEASAATKKWVQEVDEQSKETGQRFGVGKAVHVHGTPSADKHKMPKPYFISTPKTNEVNALDFGSGWNLQSYAPPLGNPHKSQINKSNAMTASSVVVHQSFQTDMTLNGVGSPVESANAIRRQQENSLAIMARGAKGVFIG